MSYNSSLLYDAATSYSGVSRGQTVAERLLQIAGQAGTAGNLMRLIGQGATAEARLLDYSRLSAAAAYVHLLASRGGYIIFARRRGRR